MYYLPLLTDEVGRKHRPKIQALKHYADITDTTSTLLLQSISGYQLLHKHVLSDAYSQYLLHFVQWMLNLSDHPVMDHFTHVHSHSTVTWCTDAHHLQFFSDMTHFLKTPQAITDK